MTVLEKNYQAEIVSMQRRADQACSIHARLRDRYSSYAGILDYSMIMASTYLLAVSIIEPVLGVTLSLGFDRQALVLFLTIVLFFFTIVQFKSDWRAKEQAHKRSASEYARVKAACRMILAGVGEISEAEYQRVCDAYNMVSDIGTHIPDAAFASGKAHHRKKVFISEYLDSHPGAWIFMIKIKLVLRDNFNVNFLD